MSTVITKAAGEAVISDNELLKALEQSISNKKPQLKKVLLLPPDFTRMHSVQEKLQQCIMKC